MRRRELKAVVTFLSFLNGGYMFADGIFVEIYGKYLGPEKPGPWSLIFAALGIDPARLGPVFIVFGLVWLAAGVAFITKRLWATRLGIVLSVLTAWYFPFGTLTSAIVFTILLGSGQGSEAPDAHG